MNNLEIEELVREEGLSDIFLGVFARTALPLSRMRAGHYLILNSDGEGRPGSHWQLLAQSTSRPDYELFDSLGCNLSYIRGILPSTVRASQIDYNERPVQPKEALTCGLFSVYVLCFRSTSEDMPLQEFVPSLFSQDLEANERDVINFFESSRTWQLFLQRTFETQRPSSKSRSACRYCNPTRSIHSGPLSG